MTIEPARESDRKSTAGRHPVARRPAATSASSRGGPAAISALQRLAGNRAVSGLLGSGSAGPVPSMALAKPSTPPTELAVQRLLPDQPPGRQGPDADPKFAELRQDVDLKRGRLTTHRPATAESEAAKRAARPPADDKLAQGKAAQADTMAAAKPGEFDKAGFIKAVNDAIAAQAPKNLSEAMDYGESGKADAVRGQVSGKVGQGTAAAKGQIASATAGAPQTDKAREKLVVPLPGAPAVATPGAPEPGKALPDRVQDSVTDLSAGPRQVDSQMSEAQVTEEQLAKSNEPEFQDALAAKKEGERASAETPGAMRAKEAAVLTGAKAEAAAAGRSGMAGMVADAARAHRSVHSGKGAAQARDEQRRAQATALLQKVFDATKRDVEAILTGLDKTVDEQFTGEEKVARDAFTAEHKRRMEEYKDDRYSGLRGKYRWVRDKLKGLPEDANKIFEIARAGYIKRLQDVIARIADTIGNQLARAKQRIAEGQAELKAEVRRMPADLRKLGASAAREFAGQFQQLTESVDAKSEELVSTLAGKYSEALGAVDAEIEEEKEKNKGLIDKVIDAVAGVIRTILQLKDMLLNVLARAASVIGSIISDPIGFLGDFVGAVKAGVSQFADRIGEHLTDGLKAWLFGSLAENGIEIPETFDIKGIIKLVLSVLGLTWKSIRARITRQIPEPVMQRVEQSVDVFRLLVSEGVGGLWKLILEKVGDVEEMIVGQIKDFVITKIIHAGIAWLISLLNPVAAFIKACKAIYEIVMFFVEKAAQIKEFVETVLDSVEEIVRGGTATVANKIESALVKLVPILIGFLASLLGVGGITEKIKEVLDTVRKPVAKAVDGIIKGALTLARPIIRAATRGTDWVKGKVASGKAFVTGKVAAGKSWVAGKAASAGAAFAGMRDRLLGITFRRQFLVNGEQHSVYTKKGQPGRLYTASNPVPSAQRVPTPQVIALDQQFRGLMQSYWQVAGQLRGSPSDATLIARANSLRVQSEQVLTQLVTLTAQHMTAGTMDPQNPGVSAPEIGSVGRHGAQPPRHREGPQVWQTESEHVLPFATGRSLWVALSQYLPERNWPEDNEQTTVVIYERAARIKTTRDNEVSREFEAELRSLNLPSRMQGGVDLYGAGMTGGEEQVRETLSLVFRALDRARRDAVMRTYAAVAQENSETETGHSRTNAERRAVPPKRESPTPDQAAIRTASQLQYDDIIRLVTEEVWHQHSVREKVERRGLRVPRR